MTSWGRVLAADVVDERTGEILLEANREITKEGLIKVERPRSRSSGSAIASR